MIAYNNEVIIIAFVVVVVVVVVIVCLHQLPCPIPFWALLFLCCLIFSYVVLIVGFI